METTIAPAGVVTGPVVPAPRAGADDVPSTGGAPGPTSRTDDGIDYPAVRYALACCPLLQER